MGMEYEISVAADCLPVPAIAAGVMHMNPKGIIRAVKDCLRLSPHKA